MNPQPVSLADELRKLVEKYEALASANDTGEMEVPLDELKAALLEQHAVAEPKLVTCFNCGGETLFPKQMYLCDDCFTELDAVEPMSNKADTRAEQPKLTEEQAHAVVIDFWNKREMPQHPISSWESALVQFALLTSPVAPPPRKCASEGCENEPVPSLHLCEKHLLRAEWETDYKCSNGHTFAAKAHSRFDKAPHHCPECGSEEIADLSADDAPPLAPGEQPRRSEYEQCHSDDKFCEKCGIVHTDKFPCHAPAAQERASEQGVMDKWREHPFPGSEKGMLVLRKAISDALSTATKLAREAFEKEQWEPWTRDDGTPLICSICGNEIPRCERGWMGDAEQKEVQHMDCGYQQKIKELQAALAAQPSPQTKG